MGLYQSDDIFTKRHPANGYQVVRMPLNRHPALIGDKAVADDNVSGADEVDRWGKTSGLETIGDDINSVNANGEPPLFVAFYCGAVDELKEILSRRPDLDPCHLRPRQHEDIEDASVGPHVLITLQDLLANHVVTGNPKLAEQLLAVFRASANPEDYDRVYGKDGTHHPLVVPTEIEANAIIFTAMHSFCKRDISPGRFGGDMRLLAHQFG